jgi:multidrug efflux pump subunit AcrA (membrane-fusion protein)
MSLFNDVRNLSLDSLIGGADEALARDIYLAQTRANDARQALRAATAELDKAQSEALELLYRRGDVGRNERERKVAEEAALRQSGYVSRSQQAVAKAQADLEQAEAEIEYSRNVLKAVCARAQVVSALLLSGQEMVTVYKRNGDPSGIVTPDDVPPAFSNKSADHDTPF